MPKKTPVKILASPEKTSVEPRSMEPVMAIAIMRGSNVPRSPRAPDSSASGDVLSVRTLCWWMRRSSDCQVMLKLVSDDSDDVREDMKKKQGADEC